MERNMENESAIKQLDQLHPAMPLGTRIAVVGGGPSGLSAAMALTKLGYENVTVLEKQATVGGMCASAVVEGRVYDLGGQVLARESSPTLRTLMAEMQIEMEDMAQHKLSQIDCSSGKYEDLKVAADYISLMPLTLKLQTQAVATGKLGVHALSDLANQPADEYLRANGVVNGVPTAVANGFTASGYGYAADVPYAYLHEFARTSMLGKIWRVKGGYSSFWEKVASSLPDVRCNMDVQSIHRSGDKVQIAISSAGSDPQQSTLEFDKLIMTGSVSYPWNNPTFRSAHPVDSEGGGTTTGPVGILDYTDKELQLFSKVRTIEYYTTLLRIRGLDLPVGFYYPKLYIEDPSTVGHPVAIQRFFADTDVYLFWSYGNSQVSSDAVTKLLLEDVESMGGKIETVILQRKWNYFPHISATDMAEGFYDRMGELQGKTNTYFVGALQAFELTERNVSFAFNMVSRFFGQTNERPYVKRLMPRDTVERDQSLEIDRLDELPGVEFPDLPSLDAYLSYYANHKVVRERALYTWLDDQGREVDRRTFADLEIRVSKVAHRLLTAKAPFQTGDRVLLLHPPGLDFVDAFFGCLRARVIPVPLIPPDPSQLGGHSLAKVHNVANACGAKAVISTYSYHTAVRAASVRNMVSRNSKREPCWPNLPWHHSDSWTKETRPWNWLFSKSSSNLEISRPVSPRDPTQIFKTPRFREESTEDESKQGTEFFKSGPAPKPSDICFLQFTSGSTGDSKGVVISHEGLLHNVKLMKSTYGSTSRTVLISWLPQYHDMGLIGGLFTTIISGGKAVLFSPTTFIRKPMLWLEAMDRYQGTHSAGPNFAFELVVRRFEMLKAKGKMPSYDLSYMRFLMISAEPIRSNTTRAFLNILHASGLREEVLAPGYGLAENCVFVCVAYGKKLPVMVDWQGRVCCGYPERGNKDVDVRIVDPVSHEERNAGVEGEIWVCSPSMGIGYWGLEELSQTTFRNSIANVDPEDQHRKFLRTGDLGRVLDGKLFVTGRIKDLIIIRGRNFYPADIEKAVENSSDLLRPGCVAIFSVPHGVLQEKGVIIPLGSVIDDAAIVAVAELRDEKKIDTELPAVIKASVAEDYGIEVASVTLIKPRTIPKTSSGKIRRIECCKRFTENSLAVVPLPPTPKRPELQRFRSRNNPAVVPPSTIPVCPIAKTGPCKQEIIEFLVEIVAEKTGMSTHEISVDESFGSYNITSVGIVWAAQKLSDFLGVHVAAMDIYTAGCISELAENSDCLVRKARSSSPTTSWNPRSPPIMADSSNYPSNQAIEKFLVQLVTERTGIAASEISTTENLTSYSINSVGVVWAAQKLSDHLGVHIAAIDVYTSGCIAELAESAGDLMRRSRPSPGLSSDPKQLTVNQLKMPTTDIFFEGETLTDEEFSYSIDPSLRRRITITAMQALGIIFIAALLLIPAAFIFDNLSRIITSLQNNSAGSLMSTAMAVALVPLAWIAYIGTIPLLISIFGTSLLQPSFTFKVAIPLWSVSYAKWWTLYRLQEFASTTLAVHLRGTVFLSWWYRLLGAHIGEGVHIDTIDITDPGLLFIGSNVVVEEGVTVQCHEVKEGIVYFRPVKINEQARLGAFSVVQRGTVLNAGASVPALGKTEVGQSVVSRFAISSSKAGYNKGSASSVAVKQLFGLYLVGLVSSSAAAVAYIPFLWTAFKLEIFTEHEQGSSSFATGLALFSLAATFPWATVGIAPLFAFQHSEELLHLLLGVVERRKFTMLLSSLSIAYLLYGLALSILTIALKWYLVGKLDTKTSTKFPSQSKPFFRIWLLHTLLRFTHSKFLTLLVGTEAACIYLRSLGAKIGKFASIRAINPVIDPDFVTLGTRSHLGDFAKLVTSVKHADSSISLSKISIGKDCVVGAQSVIMPGSTLEDQAWLGAMSVAPTSSVLRSGGVYAGVESPVLIYQKNPNTGKSIPASSGMGKTHVRNGRGSEKFGEIQSGIPLTPSSVEGVPACSEASKNPVRTGGAPEKSGEIRWGISHTWELAVIRLIQPFVQTTIPVLLLGFSVYPSILALAFVGSELGHGWMHMSLPIAYLCSGLILSASSILSRRILVGQTREGHTCEIWGLWSLCDMVWQCTNLVLNSSFLALGKGSLLNTWYLRSLGASISASAYIDTCYAINPDVLRIGAGSAVGHDALLFGHIFEGGKVSFKSISIGNYASVGTRALVLPGVKMNDDSQLAALGLGMKDEMIEAY